MKIPYGRSNFADLRRGGFFYADKTPFLPVLESAELGYAYLIFLRPRRFGKSLFVSMLEHYYDIEKAADFDALFGGLWIHEHPTPERSRYLVLSFDFSQMQTDVGEGALSRTFSDTVKSVILAFLIRYRERVPGLGWLLDRIDKFDDGVALTAALLSLVSAHGQKIYVIIDEYDHFANRLLAAGSRKAYRALAARNGFLRAFYATLKSGTASGAIGRMFITGIAPLLLDDLSSGFNIASQVSMDPGLSTLAGFTRGDVERAIDELLADRPGAAEHPDLGDRDRLLGILERFYNGYRFSPHSAERVFNSDMVLYFLAELQRTGTFPADMLDMNARTDYQRLLRIGLPSRAAFASRRELIETIAAEGSVRGRVARQFGVDGLAEEDHFLSFLYYLGMLTLGTPPAEREDPAFGHTLEIPNRVIRELQWQSLTSLLARRDQAIVGARELDEPLRRMAETGDIEPFLDLFHERVVKALGLKDLRRLDEKSMKLMLLAFLSLSRFFYPLSEKELAQGYCDLFLGVSPLRKGAKFAWLLELKYLPARAKPAQIERAFTQAAEQVERYASDERLLPLLTQGQSLRAGSLVFVGTERPRFRPWRSKPPGIKARSGRS